MKRGQSLSTLGNTSTDSTEGREGPAVTSNSNWQELWCWPCTRHSEGHQLRLV